jgi:hypothetical protein
MRGIVEQPKKYLVVRPGRTPAEFDDSKQAIEHLVAHPGYAKVYAPDGSLLFTKGTPPPAS